MTSAGTNVMRTIVEIQEPLTNHFTPFCTHAIEFDIRSHASTRSICESLAVHYVEPGSLSVSICEISPVSTQKRHAHAPDFRSELDKKTLSILLSDPCDRLRESTPGESTPRLRTVIPPPCFPHLTNRVALFPVSDKPETRTNERNAQLRRLGTR